ncbi:MAG TPA: hypothetical protein PLO07_11790 [Rubrivivax sp.]|nr:hypothetical protein [Rubrivivax sp.]
MSDDAAFAPPPFKPDEALQRLRRELRELGLSERGGVFERRGLAIARARIEGTQLAAARVERPSRASPRWRSRALADHAAVRDFANEVKRALQQWGDRDD